MRIFVLLLTIGLSAGFAAEKTAKPRKMSHRASLRPYGHFSSLDSARGSSTFSFGSAVGSSGEDLDSEIVSSGAKGFFRRMGADFSALGQRRLLLGRENLEC
jgi:hypothetical protein